VVKFLQFPKEHLVVSVITYLIAIATVFAFATTGACFGYFKGFHFMLEFKKSNRWDEAALKAQSVLYSMQAVCSLLAVTLMVLTTKRLQNLV
jgi:hypothetical protein